jgi:hypothetical protein
MHRDLAGCLILPAGARGAATPEPPNARDTGPPRGINRLCFDIEFGPSPQVGAKIADAPPQALPQQRAQRCAV